MAKNLLIVHGGGPTAVINASLYGAVCEAKKHPGVGRIYAALGGTGGLLQRHVRDMREIDEAQLRLLPATPGSAIGTSRDHLEPEQYTQLAEVLRELEVGFLLCNGGNGTMDMCGKLLAACQALGHDIRVVGIPKTMDNDLAVTDHSPGFGSAARYVAQSTRELCADVRSLPIHVVVMEALGRNAGWVTAASALARGGGCEGPDLIYLPERAFNEEEFLQDTQSLIDKKGGVVVVASEGLHDAAGAPIVPPVFEVDRSVYYGDVSAHLANLIIQKLGYKARSEKPGILGRASIALQSETDRAEAQLVGEVAVRAAVGGESGKMVALRRAPGPVYSAEPFLVDIGEVMLTESVLPAHYINGRGNGVTQAFCDWCAPLLGAPLAPMANFETLEPPLA